jgi:hypothetical protein
MIAPVDAERKGSLLSALESQAPAEAGGLSSDAAASRWNVQRRLDAAGRGRRPGSRHRPPRRSRVGGRRCSHIKVQTRGIRGKPAKEPPLTVCPPQQPRDRSRRPLESASLAMERVKRLAAHLLPGSMGTKVRGARRAARWPHAGSPFAAPPRPRHLASAPHRCGDPPTPRLAACGPPRPGAPPPPPPGRHAAGAAPL